MSKAFLDCVNKGGRVRTISLPKGKYIHVCFIGGKSYRGEVRKKESK